MRLCPSCKSENTRWLHGLVTPDSCACRDCGVTFAQDEPYDLELLADLRREYPISRFFSELESNNSAGDANISCDGK